METFNNLHGTTHARTFSGCERRSTARIGLSSGADGARDQVGGADGAVIGCFTACEETVGAVRSCRPAPAAWDSGPMAAPSNDDLASEIDRVRWGTFEGAEADEQRRVIDDAERAMRLDPRDATQRRWRVSSYQALLSFRFRHDL